MIHKSVYDVKCFHSLAELWVFCRGALNVPRSVKMGTHSVPLSMVKMVMTSLRMYPPAKSGQVPFPIIVLTI